MTDSTRGCDRHARRIGGRCADRVGCGRAARGGAAGGGGRWPGAARPRASGVYLREADLLPHLNQWLTRVFDPDHLDDNLDALRAASTDHDSITQQLHSAQQAVADTQRRLARYREVMDAGDDLAQVTTWINPRPSPPKPQPKRTWHGCEPPPPRH
jgi:hypothetical protein